MEIPKKFEINTEDFKIYFDNNKKTHVVENLETGEKTNIGVLGILMQMGILKMIEGKTEEKIKTLSEKLDELEGKIENLVRNIDNITTKTGEKEEIILEERVEEEKPKSEMNERIMKKVLEKTKDENKESIEEEVKEELGESDTTEESEEEIDNWMEI